MNTRSINAADAPAPVGGYSQAIEVRDATRLVYVSGQIPAGKDGDVPQEFRAQTRLAWSNVERQLLAAGMSLQSIVKHTTYLADRRYRDENRE